MQVLERAHAERAAALKAEEEREQQAEAGEVTHLIRPSEDNKSRAPQGPPSRYVRNNLPIRLHCVFEYLVLGCMAMTRFLVFR